MKQWTNLQRIKRFANPTRLYITCEKSGGLHQEESDLMAGRQTKFGRGLTFEKLAVNQNIRFFALLNHGTALFQCF